MTGDQIQIHYKKIAYDALPKTIEEKLIRAVQQRSKTTFTLAEELSYNIRTIRKHLASMRRRGIITRTKVVCVQYTLTDGFRKEQGETK